QSAVERAGRAGARRHALPAEILLRGALAAARAFDPDDGSIFTERHEELHRTGRREKCLGLLRHSTRVAGAALEIAEEDGERLRLEPGERVRPNAAVSVPLHELEQAETRALTAARDRADRRVAPLQDVGRRDRQSGEVGRAEVSAEGNRRVHGATAFER